MKRELKRQFYLRRDELALILAMESVFFLLGEILLGFVVYGLGEKESIIPLGTILTVMIPAFILLFLGMGSLPMCFNLSVAMSTTRRNLIPAEFIVSFLQNLAAVSLAYIFSLFERWIMRAAYGGIPVEFDLQYLFRWKYLIPACIALSALHAFMGALILKYGKIIFTIFWCLWVSFLIGGSRIGQMLEEGKDHAFLNMCRNVVRTVSNLSETGILLLVMGISLLLFFGTWMLVRKQQVEFS